MKIEIPEPEKTKCNYVIHTASVAAGGIGIAPIPGADILPICAVQVTMILGLARIFNVSITKEVAEAQAKAYMVGNFGKMLAGELSKLVPIFGSATNATVAVGLTEYLGWEVAEDFYKKSLEENRILKEAQNKVSKL